MAASTRLDRLSPINENRSVYASADAPEPHAVCNRLIDALSRARSPLQPFLCSRHKRSTLYYAKKCENMNGGLLPNAVFVGREYTTSMASHSVCRGTQRHPFACSGDILRCDQLFAHWGP